MIPSLERYLPTYESANQDSHGTDQGADSDIAHPSVRAESQGKSAQASCIWQAGWTKHSRSGIWRESWTLTALFRRCAPRNMRSVFPFAMLLSRGWPASNQQQQKVHICRVRTGYRIRRPGRATQVHSSFRAEIDIGQDHQGTYDDGEFLLPAIAIAIALHLISLAHSLTLLTPAPSIDRGGIGATGASIPMYQPLHRLYILRRPYSYAGTTGLI